jgi:hypothetical protein
MPEQIKKQRSFSSAYSSMLVDFLLSPKGPPSCWRAKPVIKAKLSVYRATEHNIYSKFFVTMGIHKGLATPSFHTISISKLHCLVKPFFAHRTYSCRTIEVLRAVNTGCCWLSTPVVSETMKVIGPLRPLRSRTSNTRIVHVTRSPMRRRRT